MNWPAIQTARRHDAATRVPFLVGTDLAGSVARQHLAALGDWPQWLQIDAAGVHLLVDRPDAALQLINTRLRHLGLIRAWRDESFAVPALDDGHLLATFERAASRFWGTLTFGAHCNGYLADADGRPSHLWIARRAHTKATDPGLLDNLVGGGVPHGQTPAECVQREGWEEAGLTPAQMAGLRPGRRLRVARDIPEGFQLEEVSSYDLALPSGLVPCNQDGEVHSVHLMPAAEALARAARGEMTVDAALVTLDFALRHGLLPADAQARLAARAAPLWVGDATLDQ
jgi:8-oxo-dGTP pyrophosphatase MutT (NUDIX family)